MKMFSVVGLLDAKAPGQPSGLNNSVRPDITKTVWSIPMPAVPGVAPLRLLVLAQWICGGLRIAISKRDLSRKLRATVAWSAE